MLRLVAVARVGGDAIMVWVLCTRYYSCILSVVDVYWSKCPFVLIDEMESYDVISVFVR